MGTFSTITIVLGKMGITSKDEMYVTLLYLKPIILP